MEFWGNLNSAKKVRRGIKDPIHGWWAAAEIPGSRIFVDNTFFDLLSEPSQDTGFFHELQHNMGKTPAEIDVPGEHEKNLQDIIEKCKTGSFPEKPSPKV